MKVPLSWLKDFLNIKLSPVEIADALTMGGLEVDKIEELDDDAIFEISLTPNLGHCMSVLGIARELAALKNLKLSAPASSFKEDAQHKIRDKISVEIKDPAQCYRYACRLVMHVKVGPSPDWLVKRLEASGVRSINNVVDVTNYVMLERGQPLHAFDYDKISGKKISVSSKSKASSITTLDDKVYTVPEGALLISDEKGPLAFAGVIGNLESSVTAGTQHILLESAFFTPQAVRKTSKLLHLRTESSQRFEKEVDFEGIPAALDRACALLQEIAGGTVVKGVIDEIANLQKPKSIKCRISRANQLLGLTLSLREVVTIFEKLQIVIEREEQDAVHVLAPSFRNDLKTEIDLIEEVGRIYGYQNIPIKHPRHVSSSLASTPLFVFEKRVRQQLLSENLQECITCDLISPSLAELTAEAPDPASWISVLQPGSIDQSVLRTSLLPGLLQTVRLNRVRQVKEISAFEIGRIHFKDGPHYKEQTMIGIICTGLSSPYHFDPKPRECDFFDLKGKIENLLLSLKISNATFEPSHLHNFHPGRQARIKVGSDIIGAFGEVHPGRLHALDLDTRVFFAELNLHELLRLEPKELKTSELAVFPGSERDWTLTVKEETPIGRILLLIQSMPSPYLESVELIDIYRDSRLGKEKKNITLRFFYREKEKTISLDTVEKEHTNITVEVAKKLEHLLH